MSYSTSPSPHSIPSIYTQCHTLHPQVLIPYHPYTLNVILYIPRSSFHTIHIHSMSYSTSPGPHSIPSIYTQCHTLHPQVLIPYHPYTLNVILYIPRSSFHTIHIHSMSYSTSPGPHSIPSIHTHCHNLHPQVLIPYHPYTLNVIIYIPRSSFHTIRTGHCLCAVYIPLLFTHNISHVILRTPHAYIHVHTLQYGLLHSAGAGDQDSLSENTHSLTLLSLLSFLSLKTSAISLPRVLVAGSTVCGEDSHEESRLALSRITLQVTHTCT